MNIETILGLLLVALNAGVAAVLGESQLQMDPLAHAALVASSAATGAVLLYIRPAAPAGSLVVPAVVTPKPVAAEAVVSPTQIAMPQASPVSVANPPSIVLPAAALKSEYPN